VAKDKGRAILSYATPNPVGPYRLVTPPTPVGPSQTKTPVLPVVGGSLVNVPLPQMPSRTSNAPAQDVGQRKQINVPNPPQQIQNRAVLPDPSDVTNPGFLKSNPVQKGYIRLYRGVNTDYDPASGTARLGDLSNRWFTPDPSRADEFARYVIDEGVVTENPKPRKTDEHIGYIDIPIADLASYLVRTYDSFLGKDVFPDAGYVKDKDVVAELKRLRDEGKRSASKEELARLENQLEELAKAQRNYNPQKPQRIPSEYPQFVLPPELVARLTWVYGGNEKPKRRLT
jgi:hypothetical protein